jgi:voltage-gated potassium channel
VKKVDPMSAPVSLADLSGRQQKMAVIRAMVWFVFIFAAVIALYYLLPLGRTGWGSHAVFRLIGGVALFLAIMTWQIRQISRASLPEVRAIQTIAVAVPLFITTYASAYVTMSAARTGSFSESLDRTDGLYFAIVTFGTVGYGDISAKSDLARIVVSSQILADLAFFAIVFRIVVAASRRAFLRRTPDPVEAEPA